MEDDMAPVFIERVDASDHFSSPTIRHNHIIYNSASNTDNVVSTGGGGIRSGDGRARILGNRFEELAGYARDVLNTQGGIPGETSSLEQFRSFQRGHVD
jgi:hypothetical protein